MLYKLKQLSCWHYWDKTYGYEERPAKNAKCIKCGKVNSTYTARTWAMNDLQAEIDKILKDYRQALSQQMGLILSNRHRLDIKTADKMLIEKPTQAILQLINKACIEAKIDELQRVMQETYSSERAWNYMVVRIKALESGTADTTGLASDKPSVRKETKFGKGK